MVDNRDVAARLRDSNLRWSARAKHGAGEDSVVQWISIAEFSEARLRIGLSEDGEWVRVEPTSAAVFQENKPFFLPMLVMRFSEVQRAIREGILLAGIPVEIEGAFPFEELVVVGLESESEHWNRLALDRISELSPSVNLFKALTDSSEHAPTQQLRHRAKKLAAKMRRELSGSPECPVRTVRTETPEI